MSKWILIVHFLTQIGSGTTNTISFDGPQAELLCKRAQLQFRWPDSEAKCVKIADGPSVPVPRCLGTVGHLGPIQVCY